MFLLVSGKVCLLGLAQRQKKLQILLSLSRSYCSQPNTVDAEANSPLISCVVGTMQCVKMDLEGTLDPGLTNRLLTSTAAVAAALFCTGGPG